MNYRTNLWAGRLVATCSGPAARVQVLPAALSAAVASRFCRLNLCGLAAAVALGGCAGELADAARADQANRIETDTHSSTADVPRESGDAVPRGGFDSLAPDVGDSANRGPDGRQAASPGDAAVEDDAAVEGDGVGPSDASAPDGLNLGQDTSATTAEPKDVETAPEAWIKGGCFGWPATPFTPDHYAGAAVHVAVGEQAPKFSLLDTKAVPHTLDELLALGPVVLIPAATSCDMFRPAEAGIVNLAKKYQGKVRFVLVYVIEPHPMAPEVSPYSGEVWTNPYSTVAQPPTLGDRIGLAQKLASNGDLLVLVDDLSPAAANPFWCSYGTVPFGAFAVDATGVIRSVQALGKLDSIEAAAQSL